MNNGENWMIFVLIAAPALFGVGALVSAIILFRSARRARPETRTLRLIGAGVLLVVALGVGACYGSMFITPNW